MAKITVLGIDYGRSHIGIAIAEDTLAAPFATVINDNSAINRIKNICEENDIKKLVMGLSEGVMKEETIKFSQELAISTHLPILYQDETLSSKDAIKALIHRSKHSRKTLQHQAAAAVILQSWIDSQLDSGMWAL
jgi:putative holliday junction resolvase